MAVPHLFFYSLFRSFLLLLTLVSTRGLAGKYHLVDIQSLLPTTSCSVANEDGWGASKFKVVHRHGPCSSMGVPQMASSHVENLLQDQSRADSIHRRRSAAPAGTSVPSISGTNLGTLDYIVSVGLGTPRKNYSVVFDTGSGLTWTQCAPCHNCFDQHDPIYDPTKSATFANISCASPYCTQLNRFSCSPASVCQYQVRYGDNSQTQGSLVQDTLFFSSDSVPNFRYGCGHDNSGLFGKADGLLGLGRQPFSLPSQTAKKYGRVFSYCLPSKSTYTGYLTLGKAAGKSSEVQYTPMLSNPNLPSFYFLKLVGIAVGGQTLALSPAVFGEPGTLLDSGTVITRLPPSAYAALRSRFRHLMTAYPATLPLSILDTCYDLSGFNRVRVPTIALVFDGGVSVGVDFAGILYVANVSQACLAFAGNGLATDVAIIGNVQQRKLHVVYDLANRKIGFARNGCT